MVVERCLNVRALLTQLITRFQVSTYYITHNANGYQCDVTAVGGRVVTTALQVNVNRTKVGKKWIFVRNCGVCIECLYSMCARVSVCVSMCVYEGMRGVCVEMTQAR